jgi:hypothetical protein
MDSRFWGPHAWIFLHSITLEYPDVPTMRDKDNMSNFFNSLGNVLPCYKCKINFPKHLIKYPLNNDVLSSKTRLVKWLIDIHNEVNIMTGKEVMPYEIALKNILEKYENKGIPNNILILIIIIIIFLTIGIVLIYNKYS